MLFHQRMSHSGFNQKQFNQHCSNQSMLFFSGLLLSCFAVCLQIAVFLQPLLPAQYQISPVCETITRALLLHDHSANSNISNHLNHQHSHQAHAIDQHKNSTHNAHATSLHDDQHRMQMADTTQATSQHSNHQHDAGHQCQYCMVYANLVLPPEFGIQEVFERIQVRLLFLQRQFAPIYFYLQRLFLIPQGRAPPLFA